MGSRAIWYDTVAVNGRNEFLMRGFKFYLVPSEESILLMH